MADIKFGTDGWRAIIGEDFTDENVYRVAQAAAKAFRFREGNKQSGIVIGYDMRKDSPHFAQVAAHAMAAIGVNVDVSSTYCPTPALCWYINDACWATGGLMITASHNPAEYSGIKLRMNDGGASPESFTIMVESFLTEDTVSYEDAVANGTAGRLGEINVMGPFLKDLTSLVDYEQIKDSNLTVGVDPMYGAGRMYLASLLRVNGVSVKEIHGNEDRTFGGLHPEPIFPWISEAVQFAKENKLDAMFITDGDADRIAAVDDTGRYINPHIILTLIIDHLVTFKKVSGLVVRTLSGSELIARQCKKLGLEPPITTPVGFKWIYEQMNANPNVIVGGEESGGIGIPGHVKERDSFLMAELLVEMMAVRKKPLSQIVDEMLAELGPLFYKRNDIRITQEQKENFLTKLKQDIDVTEMCGKKVSEVITIDGIKFFFEDDSWLLMRASGTEPLVRVYAEAPTEAERDALLDAGVEFVTS